MSYWIRKANLLFIANLWLFHLLYWTKNKINEVQTLTRFRWPNAAFEMPLGERKWGCRASWWWIQLEWGNWNNKSGRKNHLGVDRSQRGWCSQHWARSWRGKMRIVTSKEDIGMLSKIAKSNWIMLVHCVTWYLKTGRASYVNVWLRR